MTQRRWDRKQRHPSRRAEERRQFERAMVDCERYPTDEYLDRPWWDEFQHREASVEVIGGLVWGVYDGPRSRSECVGTFRIQDGIPIDCDGAELDRDAMPYIGIAHPVQLSEGERSRWAAVFAQQELAQPFAQLDREVFAADPALLDATGMADVVGSELSSTRLLGLRRRGWTPPPPDKGYLRTFTKPVGHLKFVVTVSPGVSTEREPAPVQQVASADLGRGYRSVAEEPWKFREAGPVWTSEILRDMAWLRDG